MRVHENAGRNDDVHGDEEYYTYLDEMKQSNLSDVIKSIANGGSDAYEWIKLLKDGDLFYHLIIILCKGKDKPEYSEMIKELKIEIEGWLV
jgi:predicted CopG family antitoxin